jgi:MBG domain (YGX type)
MHIHITRGVAVTIAALGFLVPSIAFATVIPDPSAPQTPQPQFNFYCTPYTAPFASGGYYSPEDGATCSYYLPAQQMASSSIFLAVYKGTPGNATLVDYDYAALPPHSILQTSPNAWASPAAGDDFFSVAMGYDDFDGQVLPENNYLTGGGIDPGYPYVILSWRYGTPPPLTATADDQSITVGDPLPALTATITGFVSGDPSDLTGVASCTTTAADSSAAGDFPITCTQGTLASTQNHYTFGTFVPGTLTIAPAAPPSTGPTVTITNPIANQAYTKSDSVTLAVTITDDVPIVATTTLLNGKPFNPAQPIPFFLAPTGTSTITVGALDADGNSATSSISVFVTPPGGNQCYTDADNWWNLRWLWTSGDFYDVLTDCTNLNTYHQQRDNLQNDRNHNTDWDQQNKQISNNVESCNKDIESRVHGNSGY